ncbi:MAG TPA: hypothetical protein VIF09_02755 [Polyangiaceae bacterium]|jgi:serine/threonine-protein kinase
MRIVAAAAALGLVTSLAACQGPGASPTPTASAGCSKDTDCKGDRICENAACTAPPAAHLPAAVSLAKVRVNSDPDTTHVSEDGVELCSSTPCDILYKGADAEPAQEHRLTFARRGYRSETRNIRVADSPVSVRLDRSP